MNRNLVILLLALILCSMWAWAQEAPVAPETQSTLQAQVRGSLWRADETIGANVVSDKGENLGSVEDIVLDRNESRIAYVIVSYGGLLGIGDKHFAVPWQAFGQTADRELSLAIDPEQLKNAPGFEKGTLPNTADPLFHEEVHSFYDAKPYSVKEQEKTQATREHTGSSSDWSSWWDWDSWVGRGDDTTWARRLSELIGTNIENAQGETIAKLQDVIVDSHEARVAYGVVSYGGTLGLAADTAIIPWNTLRLDRAREAYVTDVTLGQLEQAKRSDDEYRNLEDREYSTALYGTFGTQPYWEEFGYETERDKAQSTQVTSEIQSTSKALAKGTLWRANEAIGMDVVGANGDDLGNVEDIVLDRNESRIAYVIVSYGGLLGLGDKHFAVPWQAFGQTADRELSLAIDPEQLKNAPGFEKGTLPNTADPLFHEEVHSFYGAKPYSVDKQEKARAEARTTQEHAGESTSDWSSWWDWDSWVNRGDDTTWARRLGELIGTNIENAQGETIAELDDVILDSHEARVAYAVVSYGGTLGLAADTAIIPWNTLRLDRAREAYVANFTLAQLEQAKLSDEEYRNLEDREHSAALYGTFGTQPYWEEYGYETETD